MNKIHLSINLEFVRHDDKSIKWGVHKAAEPGNKCQAYRSLVHLTKVLERVQELCCPSQN